MLVGIFIHSMSTFSSGLIVQVSTYPDCCYEGNHISSTVLHNLVTPLFSYQGTMISHRPDDARTWLFLEGLSTPNEAHV